MILKSKLKQLTIVFCVAFLWGCIQDVSINVKAENSKVVLNSILNPGKDTIIVYLSYSSKIPSKGAKFEPVLNAEILFFENEEKVGKFVWSDSCAYILPFVVTASKKYRIEVNVEDETIWGETTLPESVEASIKKAEPTNYLDPFVISFSDSQTEENYYWVSATGNEGDRENRIKNIACALYSDFEFADDFNQQIAQNGTYHFEYNYYLRFNDKEISNNLIELEFSPQCISYPKEIYMLSVDYHLDRYMKSSLILQDMSEYSEDMPVIYAPFPTYSNVHGGTGIIGSYNSVSKVFTKD